MNTEFIIFIIIGIGSLIVGIYLDSKKKIKIEIQKQKILTQKFEKEIKEIRNDCDLKIASFDNENKQIQKILQEKEKFFVEINNINDVSIKKITSLFSDYTLLQYDLSAKMLINKRRPARTEAKRIKELKKLTKSYLEQYKLMVYKYEYLLNIFPELTDYVDDFDSIKELDKYTDLDTLTDEYDYVKKYVSKIEYSSLNENERNQLALDNYVNGKKSNWQIGRDYELFCGQYYQRKGWEVNYFGMEKKLHDLGRDLIAKKGSEIHIIQCKYWSKEKLIHEKHILQLFATTHILEITKTDLFHNYKPIFITNIELSETATSFAKMLNVEVIKMSLNQFPRIKCNINDNNKIYHLPFDQKYDMTQIQNKGEFYAFTVEEAVRNGFRRAFKYRG